MRPQTMQPVTRSFDTHTSLAQGLCCRLKEGCSFIQDHDDEHGLLVTRLFLPIPSSAPSRESVPRSHISAAAAAALHHDRSVLELLEP